MVAGNKNLRILVVDDNQTMQQIAASLTKNGRPVPIIALSGYAVSGYQAACLAGGMDGFLSKPVGLKQIQEAVRQWLSVRDTHAA